MTDSVEKLATRTITPGLEDTLDAQMEREGVDVFAERMKALLAERENPTTAEGRLIKFYGVRFWSEVKRDHPDMSAEEVEDFLAAFGF